MPGGWILPWNCHVIISYYFILKTFNILSISFFVWPNGSINFASGNSFQIASFLSCCFYFLPVVKNQKYIFQKLSSLREKFTVCMKKRPLMELFSMNILMVSGNMKDSTKMENQTAIWYIGMKMAALSGKVDWKMDPPLGSGHIITPMAVSRKLQTIKWWLIK